MIAFFKLISTSLELNFYFILVGRDLTFDFYINVRIHLYFMWICIQFHYSLLKEFYTYHDDDEVSRNNSSLQQTDLSLQRNTIRLKLQSISSFYQSEYRR